MTTPTEITCYGRVVGRNFTQEWYETASRHAGRRARQLRKLGHQVSTDRSSVSINLRLSRVGS